MEDFNPNLLLPQEPTIDSVDEHLYRIGFCLTPNRHNTRRSLIFHPILITIICIIFSIQRIASIFTANRWILLLLGDIGHFFGMRIYINLLFILMSSFVLSSQLIYYYNNNREIRPTFLTLFHMMSGSVSPSSIGLNDEHQIKKLLSLSRKIFIVVKYQSQYMVPLCAGLIAISTYILCSSLIEVVLYGIPTTLMLIFPLLYFWNFLGFQYLYYYFVCKYLGLKLKNSNDNLVRMLKEKNFFKLSQILHNNNAIYCEIKQYNSTYISKFLFTVWLLLGTMLVILIYIDIFISSELHSNRCSLHNFVFGHIIHIHHDISSFYQLS